MPLILKIELVFKVFTPESVCFAEFHHNYMTYFDYISPLL